MAATPDVRSVGDLPDAIGRTAARGLSRNGNTSLRQAAGRSKEELLASHGGGRPRQPIRSANSIMIPSGPRTEQSR